MNKNVIISGIIGFVLGIFVFGLVAFFSASSIMIVEDVSPLSYEETVQKVKDTAAEIGWKVPTVHEIHKSVKKAGFDVPPVTVIELCHPKLAGTLLEDDDARVVTSMMPCRLSVYKTSDGKVVVSRMNTGLVSKMFGGIVTDVMADATKGSEKIISSVLQ